jgi:hypothetical protein
MPGAAAGRIVGIHSTIINPCFHGGSCVQNDIWCSSFCLLINFPLYLSGYDVLLLGFKFDMALPGTCPTIIWMRTMKNVPGNWFANSHAGKCGLKKAGAPARAIKGFPNLFVLSADIWEISTGGLS